MQNQVQQGSGEGSEGSGEGLGCFGTEPGQVQQGSGEGSREGSGEDVGGFGSGEGSGRLWCRARSGSTGFQRRFRRRSGRFVAEPGQVQRGSGEGSGEGFQEALVESQVQRVPEKVAEAKPGQVHLTHANPAEVFPALGFPARFRKICKNRILRLLGIPRDTTEAYSSSSPDFRYHG